MAISFINTVAIVATYVAMLFINISIRNYIAQSHL